MEKFSDELPVDAVLSGVAPHFKPLEFMSIQTEVLKKAYIESILNQWDPPEERKYKWRWLEDKVVNCEEYRGVPVYKVHETWRPPLEPKIVGVVESLWSLYDGYTKPAGLNKKNYRIRHKTRDWENPKEATRTFNTRAQALAYIDEQLRLDRMGLDIDVKTIVDFLKKMPCTCGEYDSMSERDYLEKACELVEALDELE